MFANVEDISALRQRKTAGRKLGGGIERPCMASCLVS
jgi:hypothetical protein